MPDKLDDDDQADGEKIRLEDVDNDVEDTEDGGAIIRMKNEKDDKVHLDHFANIVEEVDQSLLKGAVTDLLDKIERDKEALALLERGGWVGWIAWVLLLQLLMLLLLAPGAASLIAFWL